MQPVISCRHTCPDSCPIHPDHVEVCNGNDHNDLPTQLVLVQGSQIDMEKMHTHKSRSFQAVWYNGVWFGFKDIFLRVDLGRT